MLMAPGRLFLPAFATSEQGGSIYRLPLASCLAALSDRRSARWPMLAQPGTQGAQHRHAPDVLTEVKPDLGAFCITTTAQLTNSCNTVLSLRRLAGRRTGLNSPSHAQLRHHPQDIAGQLDDMQNQAIGGELARRQALQVEIGLDLAVELREGCIRLITASGASSRLAHSTGLPAQPVPFFSQRLCKSRGG